MTIQDTSLLIQPTHHYTTLALQVTERNGMMEQSNTMT